MANFCSKCGAPLIDGQPCPCQNTPVPPAEPKSDFSAMPQSEFQNAPQPAAAAAPQNPQSFQSAPQWTAPTAPQGSFQGMPQQGGTPMQYRAPAAAPSPVAIYFKRFLGFITSVCKAPDTILKQYTVAKDTPVGLGLIALNSLLFSFLMLTLAGNVNHWVARKSYGLSSLFGSAVKMPLAPIFFVTLLVTFGLCLLFAAIALFYHRVAFRSGTTYTAMLCASGAGSLASSPFLLVAILFCFINIPLALLIAGLGVLLSLFFTVSSIRGGAPLPDDKAVYALFLTYATHLIAILIVISIVKPLYFPTAVTSLLGL